VLTCQADTENANGLRGRMRPAARSRFALLPRISNVPTLPSVNGPSTGITM
jgi:hypothetical protein